MVYLLHTGGRQGSPPWRENPISWGSKPHTFAIYACAICAGEMLRGGNSKDLFHRTTIVVEVYALSFDMFETSNWFQILNVTNFSSNSAVLSGLTQDIDYVVRVAHRCDCSAPM